MSRSIAIVLVSFLAVACSRGRDVTLTDSGIASGTDTGTSSGTDSGPRPDTGTTTGDPCATDAAGALSTLGCNGGFASGDPAAGTPGGTCTGDDAMPQGTCSSATNICSAATGAAGWCFPTCTMAGTYITRGTCPTGFRCFTLTDAAICFRDCDTSHPCPTGMMCDEEGSCVPPAG